MTGIVDGVKHLVDVVEGAVAGAEAAVVAEAVAIKRDLWAEFDVLVADVRKLEAHLGFTPKA